ncbi:hypothetical protein ACOMHN_059361 [Nucella lapillus]
MSDTESDYDPDNIGGSTSEESVHESEESSDSEDYSDEGDAASDESDAASGEEHGDQGDAVPAVGGVWLPVLGEDPGPAPIPFTAVPGPKHLPPPESKPIDYANLFFPPALVDKILQETNLYARQWIETHQQHLRDHPRSMVHQWIKQEEASGGVRATQHGTEQEKFSERLLDDQQAKSEDSLVCGALLSRPFFSLAEVSPLQRQCPLTRPGSSRPQALQAEATD